MSEAAVHFDFTDRVVLVTGGGTGIGRAVARAFDAAGARVVVAGRRREPLDEVVSESRTGRSTAHSVDLGVADDVDRLLDEVISTEGRLDVVVSNAGLYVGGSVDEVTRDQWRDMVSTNIEGLFNLTRSCFPHLAACRGSLVAVSSVSGLRGDWSQAPYNATKGAVSQMVRSLALDWGPAGVRVNAIAPSLTDTAATHDLVVDDVLAPQFAARTGLGRLGTPEDMAGPVLFLASEAAAYVTGVILPVDGGTSASSGQAHVA